MTGRSVMAGLLASAMVAAVGTAQNTRSVERAPNAAWNALANDTTDDSPTVELWLENGPAYSYGTPVRVRFRVSDDAYVIVARVNANGHLTILYPSSRLTTSEVAGGREIDVRGRRGPGAFYADDRMGGGFIFAVASYDPFVLTRLGIRDFDRYVTGTYVGRPTQVYVGDPHQVVTRFVNMVSFSDASPYDYAVEYYNVDAPYFVTSAGYSSYCSGYNHGAGDYNNTNWYRPTLAERWDDDYYGYYGSTAGCDQYAACAAYGLNSFGYSSMYTSGIGFYPVCYPRNQGNAGNPPVTPPGTDSMKVPRWLTDSIGGRRPDTVGVLPPLGTDPPSNEDVQKGGLRRMNTGTQGPRGPVIIADDPTDHSYAIPGRALRHSPITIGQTRDPATGSPIDRPDRRSASAANGGASIDWVRPPREVVRAPVGNDNEQLPRSPRARGNGNGVDRSRDNGGGRPSYVNPSGGRGGQVRAAEPPRYDPPTRTQGPRFDTPRPTERTNGSGPRYAEPPRNSGSPRIDSPRPVGASSSGGDRSSAGSAPSRAEHTAPPPRPAPAPVSPPVTSGEKKPEKP